MIIQITLLITGILLLWIGSGIVVESAKKLAKRLKISQTLVGLTIISIGTSIPEIMTNLFSGLKVRFGTEASGIAIGTNIGSDIIQITFILGFTALLGTMYTTKKLLKRDGVMVLFSIIAVFLVGITGFKVNFFEGVILLFIYLIYLYYISKDEKFVGKAIDELGNKHREKGYFTSIFIMAFGIVILILASKLVVESALNLSEIWGVAQSFIGVMIIGVGTGLPELSTAIRAILKKAGAISLGTLIGSNITDPMFSLPIGAIAAGSVGLNFDKNLLFFDIPFWFFATIVALFLMKRNMRIGKEERKEGIILILLYIIFVFIKIRFFM